MADYGPPLGDITPEDFEKPASVLRLGLPPACVDILGSVDGVDFDSAWEVGAEHTVDGFRARYISAEHLIANKLASGSPQNLADVAIVGQSQAARKKAQV